MAEQLSQAAEHNEDSPEKLLFEAIDLLSEIVGEEMPDIPENPSQQQLLDINIENVRDGEFTTINELLYNNAVVSKLAALQREAALAKKEVPASEQELIAANVFQAYHEHMLHAVNHVRDILMKYQRMRSAASVSSEEISTQEQYARVYVERFADILAERLAFANVSLLNANIDLSPPNKEELVRKRDVYLRDLTPASKRAIDIGGDVKKRQGNLLNEQVLDILGGHHDLPGLPENYLPQYVYFLFLKKHYASLLRQEQEIASDSSNVQAKTEYDTLILQKQMAEKDADKELTTEEIDHMIQLKKRIDDNDLAMKELRAGRKNTLDELVKVTQALGDYQVSQSKLATIQHQFGDGVDLTDASALEIGKTPPAVFEQMEKNMHTNSEHHLGTVGEMMTVMKEDVLTIGVREQAADFYNKHGREAVRKNAHRIAHIFTLPVPEVFGLREKAKESLTEPLDEALGWPAGKDDWDELTPEEKKRVEERAKSVMDAINAFDKEVITNTEQTIATIRSMPDAKNFRGQDVRRPLPTDRITPDNRDEMITRYGGATVYYMLFDQYDADVDGFMAEYGEFLVSTNETIDVNVDVQKATDQLQDRFTDLGYSLFGGAFLALGGVGAAVFLARYGVRMARGTWRLASGTARLGYGVARNTVRGLSRLSSAEVLNRARYLQSERSIMRALKNTRVGRLVRRLRVMRGVRGAGRLGKTAGRSLGAAAVVATTAYEYLDIREKKKNVAENTALTEEYSSQQNTALLEGAGFGATLAIGLGPAVAIAPPLLYAGHKARQRSESRANWKRDEANWITEFSSSGLKQKLVDMRPGAELETEAGALRPRGYDWFYRIGGYGEELDTEQQDAVELISNANAAARKSVYEAYFAENLLAPEELPEDEAALRVIHKVRYLSKVTHGGMERVPAEVLTKADAYSYLQTLRREKEQRGEPLLLSYFDEQGERQWVNLEHLNGTREEALAVVADYTERIQQLDELIFFNSLGEATKDITSRSERTRKEKMATERVRSTLLLNLLHDIHETERAITAIDWPGVDISLGIEFSDGQSDSEGLVRWYLRSQLHKAVNTAVPKLLAGELTTEEYKELQGEFRGILQQVLDVESGKMPSTEFRKRAENFFARAGGQANVEKAEEYAGNPLYELLFPKE